MVRFLFGFAIAAGTFAYLITTQLEVDPLVAIENFGFMIALSFGMMFMKFGFHAFKLWNTDNDVKMHLVSQWDRVFGISGWLMMCIGIISALQFTETSQMMSGLSLAVYGLFYSYILKGFLLTALYPNPDDDLYFVETNHKRHSKIEAA